MKKYPAWDWSPDFGRKMLLFWVKKAGHYFGTGMAALHSLLMRPQAMAGSEFVCSVRVLQPIVT